MPRPALRPLRLRAARALLLAVLAAPAAGTTACATWHHATEREVAPVPSDPDARVRVTRRDGAMAVLTRVRVQNDTLAGDVVDPEPGTPTRVAISLREVERVELRRVDTDRTVLLVIGVGVGAALLAVLAVVSALSDWN
jgi:hypothetical protein